MFEGKSRVTRLMLTFQSDCCLKSHKTPLQCLQDNEVPQECQALRFLFSVTYFFQDLFFAKHLSKQFLPGWPSLSASAPCWICALGSVAGRVTSWKYYNRDQQDGRKSGLYQGHQVFYLLPCCQKQHRVCHEDEEALQPNIRGGG